MITFIKNKRYYLLVDPDKCDIEDILITEDIHGINENSAVYQITEYREYIEYLTEYFKRNDNLPFIYIDCDYFTKEELTKFMFYIIRLSIEILLMKEDIEQVEYRGKLYAPIEINYN